MEYTVNELDKFDVAIMQQLKLPFFMPMMIKTVNNCSVAHYKEDNYVPIDQFPVLSEELIITVLNSLLTITKDINQHFLCENKLSLSLNAIFIYGTSVKWCYYPDIKKPSQLDVSPLLKNLLLCETTKLETVRLLPLYQWLNRPVYCDELAAFLKQQKGIEKDTDNNNNTYIAHADYLQKESSVSDDLTYDDWNTDDSLHFLNKKEQKINTQSMYSSIWQKIVTLLHFKKENRKPLQKAPVFEETMLLIGNNKQQKQSSIVDVVTKKAVVLLDNQDFIIGSFYNNDFDCLQSHGISRRHVKIIKTSQGYILSDLNSKNGTLVNGKKLEQREFVVLENGDEITVGSKVFQFLVK